MNRHYDIEELPMNFVYETARELAQKLGDDPSVAEKLLTEALLRLLGECASRPHPHPVRTGGSYMRVAVMADSEQAKPLQRCLGNAAASMMVSPYYAARLLTFFLEEIANEVQAGNVVRIPGFGIFGPWRWTPKRGAGRAVVYPRFVASRCFRNLVSSCHLMHAKNEELQRYQRHHHPTSRSDRAASTTPSAMEAWRRAIAAQAHGLDTELD